HLNFCSAASQFGGQPRWVHMAMSAYMMLSSPRMIQTPYFSLKRSSTSPGLYESGYPALKSVGGSKSTLGNMKRIVAVRPATLAAVKAVHARASQLNSRRVFPRPSGCGLAAAAPAPVFPGAGAEGACVCGSLGAISSLRKRRQIFNLLLEKRISPFSPHLLNSILKPDQVKVLPIADCGLRIEKTHGCSQSAIRNYGIFLRASIAAALTLRSLSFLRSSSSNGRAEASCRMVTALAALIIASEI